MDDKTTQTAERPQPMMLDVEPTGIAQVQPESRQEARRADVVRPISDRPGTTMGVDRVIVRHSPEIADLFGALALAQGAFDDLERTRTARIEGSKAKYSFDYETLADVIEATKKGLSENGLAVLQFPFPSRNEITIRTILGHKSGQWISNDLSAALDGTDPRSIGSGITYLCRYARKSILGIAAAYDDDAEATAQLKQPPPQAAQRQSQQAPAQAQASSVATPTVASAAQLPSNEGVITDVAQRGQAWMVRLDTGFAAGTKVEATADTAKSLKLAARRVRLKFTPAADPQKYAPWISEIEIVGDAVGQ